MCPTKTATTTNTNDEESDTSDYSSDTAPTPYGSSFFEGVEKLLEVWFTTVAILVSQNFFVNRKYLLWCRNQCIVWPY